MNSDTCRICLGQGFLTSIFKKRGLVRISTQVISLANVNISPNDGLPNKICSVCLRKLDGCTEFIHLCQSSDTKLRTSLYKNSSDEDSQIAIETDFENGNYSLGIEDENFSECNFIADNNYDDKQVLSVSAEDTLEKRSKKYSFQENQKQNRNSGLGNKLSSSDKKKTEKQQCFTCGKVMSSRFRLKTHLRTHTGERPFTCLHCNKNFSLEQNLKVHMRVHTGEKPLHCSICGESFAQTAGLAAHKRKHTGQTPYNCLLCPRSFRTNGHLQYHVRRHTGEKNFECDTCNKAFITRSGLKQHLLTHTSDRPYVCAVCGKRMKRASHVKRHMQQAHKGQFICNICPAKFQQKTDFEKHMEMHESEKT